MRDLDLMNLFRKFDTEPVHSDLEGMWRLQFRSGNYYFGEYFSQGPLKIANKCQVVPAGSIFRGNRLLFLLPNLADIDSNQRYVERSSWANDVCMLRSIIWPNERSFKTISGRTRLQMFVVGDLANLFDPGWRLPMAVCFAALIGQYQKPEKQRYADVVAFSECFKSDQFSEARSTFDPSEYITVDENAMPELAWVNTIFRDMEFDIRSEEAPDAVPGLRERIGNFYKTPAPQKVSWSYDSTEVLSEHIARRMKQLPVQLTIGELIELFQSQAILGFDWKAQEAVSRLDMTEGLAGRTSRKIKRRPIQLIMGEVLGLNHGRASPRVGAVQDGETSCVTTSVRE